MKWNVVALAVLVTACTGFPAVTFRVDSVSDYQICQAEDSWSESNPADTQLVSIIVLLVRFSQIISSFSPL